MKLKLFILVGMVAIVGLGEFAVANQDGSSQGATIEMKDWKSPDQGATINRQTWIKNTRTGTATWFELDQARLLSGGLELFGMESSIFSEEGERSETSVIEMKVDQQVEQGRITMGILQGGSDPWKDPQMEMEEDYWGSFNISRKMTITTTDGHKEQWPDWLDCCNYSGGWGKNSSTRTMEIFDCTVPAKVAA
ncbi:MAG: hypothetical protein JW986_11290 [Methanotrichaceae archaeon]|nr:hypothetical protein [Methanotrichaceae archaeon]